GQLFLDQLVGGQRTVELLAVQRVLTRCMPAELGGAEHAPGNAEARLVETAERALQAFDVGQQRILADLDAVHDDLTGDRGAERQLALDLRSLELVAGGLAIEHEAADLIVELGPDDEYVGERRV